LKVSDLAREAGIAPSAVRWYEAAGVIPPAERKDNGYREYTEDDLARLRIVVSLRKLGLDPIDAGKLAALYLEPRRARKDVMPLLAAHRVAIQRQRHELDRMETELLDLERRLTATR
jgi:DNA-binding transcriptional MerR regulator